MRTINDNEDNWQGWEITDEPTKRAVLERSGLQPLLDEDARDFGKSFLILAAHGEDCSYIALRLDDEVALWALHWSSYGEKARRKQIADRVRERLSAEFKVDDSRTITQHGGN
tara:strand:- start:24483 stop:24821 length:339 start_codon:yes stop_codon:yes gene_type:complete